MDFVVLFVVSVYEIISPQRTLLLTFYRRKLLGIKLNTKESTNKNSFDKKQIKNYII